MFDAVLRAEALEATWWTRLVDIVTDPFPDLGSPNNTAGAMPSGITDMLEATVITPVSMTFC